MLEMFSEMKCNHLVMAWLGLAKWISMDFVSKPFFIFLKPFPSGRLHRNLIGNCYFSGELPPATGHCNFLAVNFSASGIADMSLPKPPQRTPNYHHTVVMMMV